MQIPLTRSVSASRQFVVYCEDKDVRQSVASDVEGIKESFLRVLRLRDEWTAPIVIVLKPSSSGGVSLDLFQADPGLKVQLTLGYGEGVEMPPRNEIIRALLLELAYRGRDRIDVGQEVGMPPQWVVDGLAGVLSVGEGKLDTRIYSTLVKSGSLPELESFLAEDLSKMDSTSRGLHAVYATAMVRMLMDEPQGVQSLVRLLRLLPETKAISPDFLLLCFPTLDGGVEVISKKWALAMARLSTMERLEYWSVAESDRHIQGALTCMVSGDEETKTFTIDQFEELAKRKDTRELCAALSNQVEAIAVRVHPVLAPVLSGYVGALGRLAKDRTKGLKEELAALAAYRQGEVSRAEQVADHMNWVEATQIGAVSGVFDGYIERASNPRAAPKREDAISKYLDFLELEYE